MPPRLSLMTVTRAEPFSWPFLQTMSSLANRLNAEFVIGVDSDTPQLSLSKASALGPPWIWYQKILSVRSAGYIESVHDDVLAACHGDYVLRLDDDEQCSSAMIAWLANGEYLAEPLWKFPRANLWITPDRYIVNAPLWPDHQTRLGRRELMGGRNHIHCGSPFGGGAEAPVVLEHHKFLVKSREERQAIADRYDAISPGAGSCMIAFSVPEVAFPGGIISAALSLGEHTPEDQTHG